MRSASLTAVARHLDFVRETDGPNSGAWVSFLQRFCGGKAGDSWCADFVSVVLDIAYRGSVPLRRTGSTRTMLSDARIKGYVVDNPVVDGLYFFVRSDGMPHHVGIVTDLAPLSGIAGNTSESGTSANGDGVYEHNISVPLDQIVFARLPK